MGRGGCDRRDNPALLGAGKAIGIMPLQIVGTVLSVMQVALGVQMILGGLRMIGVLQ